MQAQNNKPVQSFNAPLEDFGPFTTVYTFEQVREIRRVAIEETKKHCEEIIDELVKEDGEAVATLKGVINEMDQRIVYFMNSNQALDQQVTSYRNKYAIECEKTQGLELEINNLRALYKLATDTYQQVGAENKRLNRQILGLNKDSSAVEQLICAFEDRFAALCRDVETARSLALALDIPVAQVSQEQDADEDIHVPSPSPPASPAMNSRVASPAELFEGQLANAEEGVLAERSEEFQALNEEIQRMRDELIDLTFACQAARDERDVAKDEVYQLSGQLDLQARVIDRLRLDLSNLESRNMESFQGQTQACLELAQLREKNVALERELRIAKSDCERMKDEKYQAINKNKHLDEAMKKLKGETLKIKDKVKAEMEKQNKTFIEECLIASEQISGAGLALADEAYQSQVKYYQDTADLAQRHVKVLDELRELRAVLVKGEVGEDVPILQQLEGTVRDSQLKRAVAENELLHDQLKTQHIFIHSTEDLESEKLKHYMHCVELEGKITGFRNRVEELEREASELKKTIKIKDEIISKHKESAERVQGELAGMFKLYKESQSKLAETQHQFFLSEQCVADSLEGGVLELLRGNVTSPTDAKTS